MRFDVLVKDNMMYYGRVVKNIEIIGEAAVTIQR